QVKATDTQAGNTEYHADQRGEHTTHQYLHDQGRCRHADTEIPRSIGANRHEGARSYRNLPTIADQNIQAYGSQRQDQERDQDSLQKIVRSKQRHQQKSNKQHTQDKDSILPDREDLLICPISAFELAVFTIKHSGYPIFFSLNHQTRSMIFSSNKIER